MFLIHYENSYSRYLHCPSCLTHIIYTDKRNTRLPAPRQLHRHPALPPPGALRHEPAHSSNSTIVLPPSTREKEQEKIQGLYRCRRFLRSKRSEASAVRPCPRPTHPGEGGGAGDHGHTTTDGAPRERGRVRPHTEGPSGRAAAPELATAHRGPQTPRPPSEGSAVPRPANPSRGNRRQRDPLPAPGDSGGPADTERRREGAPYPPICPA